MSSISRPGFHPPVSQAPANPGKTRGPSNTAGGTQHAEARVLAELERTVTACRDNADLTRELLSALRLDTVPQAHEPEYEQFERAILFMAGTRAAPEFVFLPDDQGSRAFRNCAHAACCDPTLFSPEDKADIWTRFTDAINASSNAVLMPQANELMIKAIEESAAAPAA